MSDCRHNAPNRGPHAGDVQTQWQQLDEQSREELIDKLVDCLYSFEGDTDTSAIDRCLEELEAAGAGCEPFDVEQGLKDFHERFAPAFEDTTPVVKKKSSRRCRPLARIAIIAAALCAFVVTAQASGFDLLGAIARWTSEQFAFVREGDERETAPETEFLSLTDALLNGGVTEKLSPTKFPDGAELTDLRVRREEEAFLFFATYTLEEGNFFVSIRTADKAPYTEVEINSPEVPPYIAGGIEHHLMEDVKQRKATWYNGPWECYIAGNISEEDLRMMIDSIYE